MESNNYFDFRRSVIEEKEVEEIVKAIPEIECVEGKYIIRKK